METCTILENEFEETVKKCVQTSIKYKKTQYFPLFQIMESIYKTNPDCLLVKITYFLVYRF
jgi:hypothetical protein